MADSDSGGPPLVTLALWDEAAVRAKYSRRHRGPVSQRTYALSTLLACAACGRRLSGHVGRYRHVDACAEFRAAKPAVVPWRSPGDRRLKGESYKVEVYDNLVPRLLARVSFGARTMTSVVEGLAVQPSSTFTMARIERDRDAALRTYRQERDTTVLERTMKRLDDEEREAEASTRVISAAEAVAWLRDLPALWAAADDSGRRLLTEALFEKAPARLGAISSRTKLTEMAGTPKWAAVARPSPIRSYARLYASQRAVPTIPSKHDGAQHAAQRRRNVTPWERGTERPVARRDPGMGGPGVSVSGGEKAMLGPGPLRREQPPSL
jgi:hypothetical protein